MRLRRTVTAAVAAALLLPAFCAAEAKDTGLRLTQRSRVVQGADQWEVVYKETTWNPKQTAVIVCDMWDLHHSLNATKRGAELAPRMNQVLEKARGQGVFIIHAPSSCMAAYKDHPGRKRAQSAPKAENLPKDIASWCYKIPSEEKGVYPLDQTDGGDDSEKTAQAEWQVKLKALGRNPGAPWKAQTDLLKIHDEDAISDSGVEIWSLLEQRGIKNVILLGVHTNMCVLGRPFGLRQMSKNGKNVVLMRDMTDTMYNPARWPNVSHFHGTNLIVEHIEKFVCPTVTSNQVLGGRSFRFAGDARPKALVLIAEPLYDTKTTLPPLVHRVLEDQLGIDTTVLQGGDKGEIRGLADAIAEADLVLLSVRRRGLPEAAMAALRKHIESGKALVALRTSCHAFDVKGKAGKGLVEWPKFDPEVLGGNYIGHHADGPTTTVKMAPGAEKHPILAGVRTPFPSKGSLYKVRPLASSTTALLLGFIPGQEPEPVAWTNNVNKAKVFFTSLGQREDFENAQFVRLMHNGVRWALQMPEPAPPAAKKTASR